MKKVLSSLAFLSLLVMLAGLFSGCVATHPDDSDQPWNVPGPNEGVPNLPGMNNGR